MRLSIRYHRGFTLLEIMLVVIIIAILVGGAVVMVGPHIEVTREITAKDDLQKIATDIQLYQTQNRGFPTTEQGLNALVQKPTTEPVPPNWRPLAQSVPLDPWGQPYHYQYPGTHGSLLEFDLWSSGHDKQSGTADDIGNWQTQAQNQ